MFKRKNKKICPTTFDHLKEWKKYAVRILMRDYLKLGEHDRVYVEVISADCTVDSEGNYTDAQFTCTIHNTLCRVLYEGELRKVTVKIYALESEDILTHYGKFELDG